jgi:hypothetical protein
MATITEDYVSFETAKLLKEKGFNEKSRYYYRDHDKALVSVSLMCGYSVIRNKDLIDDYAVPTQQMAMKWLREVHNIDISIISLRSHKEYLPRIESDSISHDAIPCRKYEEACEVAIKYCLS